LATPATSSIATWEKPRTFKEDHLLRVENGNLAFRLASSLLIFEDACEKISSRETNREHPLRLASFISVDSEFVTHVSPTPVSSAKAIHDGEVLMA
jgi:hypothetical protein